MIAATPYGFNPGFESWRLGRLAGLESWRLGRLAGLESWRSGVKVPK